MRGDDNPQALNDKKECSATSPQRSVHQRTIR
jgi:hypothetical protein